MTLISVQKFIDIENSEYIHIRTRMDVHEGLGLGVRVRKVSGDQRAPGED